MDWLDGCSPSNIASVLLFLEIRTYAPSGFVEPGPDLECWETRIFRKIICIIQLQCTNKVMNTKNVHLLHHYIGVHIIIKIYDFRLKYHLISFLEH